MTGPGFGLSDEQRSIQEAVREFVDGRILPNAVANDQAHHLDLDVIAGMAELGILGAPIPEAWGGSGLDFVSEALICEEIERGEAAFRTLISVHVGLNSLTLLRFGTDEQRERWLRPQARGERIGCFGLTEPDAGSDVAAMQATARRTAAGWSVSGRKTWISYATVADHALCFARTDPEAGHRGITAFMVDLKTTPGVSTSDIEHKLGIWAGSTGEIVLDEAELPDEAVIGRPGEGFKVAMYALDHGRFTVAAGAVGVIRACRELSTRYARERSTFGQPIGRHQLVQDKIAELVLMEEQARLLVWKAGWAKDQARESGARTTRETSIAKLVATEYAFRAADLAVQIHGAYGYAAEYGVERHLRNSRAPRLYEGTSEIHRMLLAEDALGFRSLDG